MAKLKPGDRVRMSNELKTKLRENSLGHLREFGNCVGVVLGPTDYNNVPKTDPTYDKAKVGPEVDVRWEPSNLRYAYDPALLKCVRAA